MEKTLSEIISQMDIDDLTKIIELFARKDPDLEKMIRNSAAGKDAVYEAIKSDISAVRRSQYYYGWQDCEVLYDKLNLILDSISFNITLFTNPFH